MFDLKLDGKQSKRHFSGDNHGVTLVELIASFALLAIFFLAVTVVISNAVLTYGEQRKTEAAYTVADLVMDSVRDDIRSMQASDATLSAANEKSSGFIKLRGEGGTGLKAEAGTKLEGYTLEFVRGNEDDSVYLEQIDALGFNVTGGTVMVRTDQVFNSDLTSVNAGYLVKRYYKQYLNEDKDSAYSGRFVDAAVSGTKFYEHLISTGATLDAGTKLVRDEEEPIPTTSYDGFTVLMNFSLTPEAKVDEDGNSKLQVKCVNVTVSIYDSNMSELYTKTRSMDIMNTVYYNNSKTLYSEGE